MVNEAKSSNRRLVIGLAIGALLLALVAAIVIVVLVLGGDEEGEGAAVAKSAALMPRDTFSFTTFNPHLDQAKNFEVLDKAWGDNPILKQGLDEILSSMQEEGLDYKADVESWLGDELAFSVGPNFLTALSSSLGASIEETFAEIESALDPSGALTQPPLAAGVPEIPQITIAVATKDTAASDRFLGKLRAEVEKDGTAWQETDYKGVQVVYYEPEYEGDPGVAYATVDDFVVLTVGGLEPMQEIIDARDGDGTSLAENQTYKDVLANLPTDQIGYGFVGTSALMDVLLQAAGSELAGLPPDLLNPEQLKALKGIGYSMGLEPNGLRMDFTAVYDKDALPEGMVGAQTSTDAIAERVPASALFYLAGSGLGNLLQTGLDAITAMPDQPPDLDEQLEMMTAMLGVSIGDLVEMLSGGFALAITHDPAGIAGDPSVPVGASFLMEAKDESKFQSLINSVSTLLTFGAEMEFPKETLNGVEVMTVPDPSSGNMMVGWGVGKGYFAIGTSKELLEAAFGGGGDKLGGADMYKAAVAPLPEKRSGLFFLNMEGLFDVVVEAMGPADRASFEEARSIFGPIKAISAGAQAFDKDANAMSGTLFILIESE